MRGQTHILDVWGDLACFTRPELKVERYSYPVITPSAARGIFDAIYWKRSYGFYWQVERVEVLKPPRYIPLRRNEVKDKAPSPRTIGQWMNGSATVEPLWADGDKAALGSDQKGRTQRQTMALKDVRYRLHAHMRLRGGGEPRALDAQFQRRAQRGQAVYQPYFGCREFPAWFELAVGEATPAPFDLDLGWMLYDTFDLGRDNGPDSRAAISVFRARVRSGVLDVPAYDSSEVAKGVGVSGHA